MLLHVAWRLYPPFALRPTAKAQCALHAVHLGSEGLAWAGLKKITSVPEQSQEVLLPTSSLFVADGKLCPSAVLEFDFRLHMPSMPHVPPPVHSTSIRPAIQRRTPPNALWDAHQLRLRISFYQMCTAGLLPVHVRARGVVQAPQSKGRKERRED